MKQRIYEIIELSRDGDRVSTIYDYTMMAAILIGLVPLAFKETTALFTWIDHITVALFLVDYILREWTADLKMRRGAASYFLYPLTFLALIDLISILPSFIAISSGLKVLRVLRIVRTFRVFRAFKMLRYSKSVITIANVLRKQKTPLLAVWTMAIAYVLIAALVIFNVEPDTFHTFFEAVYWATISLTTVGYGDIAPVTTAGKAVTILSSFMGVAIVALPSGIITAGYMKEIAEQNRDKEETDA